MIREELLVAATERSEPIATGENPRRLDDLGNPREPGSEDGAVPDRPKITCPDGTVRIGFMPKVGAETQGQTQRGFWTIVSGTGAFERLRGSGKSEAVYG